MTREEAIKVLDEYLFSTGEVGGVSCVVAFDAGLDDTEEALDMAIAALREQEERSSKRISTSEELKSYQGRCVLWNGVICSCKNGYLVSDNGTFSFDWVLSHGEVYSCPL